MASAVIRYLRRFTAAHADELTDGQLLRRFTADRDEAAFEVLLRRHAAMVFRVCNRALPHTADAEDAFQATFLVLVRKAGSLGRSDLLAGWLHGVARRVAAHLRSDLARRGARERHGTELPDAPAPAAAVHPLAPVLDEEVSRLPEKYRAPVVLCYLEGMTNEEAARRLRWPVGTVKGRLGRARAMLRRRLARRGVALAAVLSASVAPAARALPAPLLGATTRAALRFVSGQPLAGAAAALAEGVLHTMTAAKPKAAVALLLLVGVCGAGMLARPTSAEPAVAAARPAARTAPDPAAAGQPAADTFPLTVSGRATDPDGKPVQGATIYLVTVVSSEYRPVGQAVTDAEGNYTIRDAKIGPVKSQVPFQVCGTADGYGFTWHGVYRFEPHPRPAGLVNPEDKRFVYLNEPVRMDLLFGPEAKCQGRIRDEKGRPLQGVKITFGFCDLLRPAPDPGRQVRGWENDFDGFAAFPLEQRTATTNRDGLFRRNGLPAEAIFSVTVEHPDYASLGFYLATTEQPLPERINFRVHPSVDEKNPVWTGNLNLTLHSPRRIPVRAVWDDTGKAATGIRLYGYQNGLTRTSSGGVTNAAGQLLMRLPPGEYRVVGDPPRTTDYIRTYQSLTVAQEPAEQPLEFRVKAGCVLLLEVVDEATGRGIPGVQFRQEDERFGTDVVQRWTNGSDGTNKTDEAGKFRAVVAPGKRRVQVADVHPAYEPVDKDGRVLELPAGKTVTARFPMRKK